MDGKPRHERPRHRRRRIAGVALLVVLLALIAGAFLCVSTYYHAGAYAQEALVSDETVNVSAQEDGDFVFEPADAGRKNGAGIVFYPGAKVESTAYAPLMHAFAERGFTCVLVKMPFNLAFLDVDAADGERDAADGVERWYMGGHSLGGAMAARYLAGHEQDFVGIVLCASYSTDDLRGAGLSALSVYGSDDGVLNREHYDEDRPLLPDDTRELVIAGGCHAYFGDYGAQEGDGEPSIPREEQVAQTADAFSNFDAERFTRVQ